LPGAGRYAEVSVSVLRFLLPSLLLLSACSASPLGEVGMTACSNKLDDDHDQLVDCEDPDCQDMERCGRLHVSPPGTGGSTANTGGSGGAPTTVPAFDAGRVEDEDGGWLGEEDGGSVPADAGTPDCGVPDCSAPRSFVVTVSSAMAANTEGRPPYACLDEFSNIVACYPSFCGCTIDPYVVVSRVRGDDVRPIYMTEAIEDTIAPTFKAAGLPIELLPGDALQFDVMDQNAVAPPSLLFSCVTALPKLEPQTILCKAETSTVRRPLFVTAKLSAAPAGSPGAD
jgi:hypothetical protein